MPGGSAPNGWQSPITDWDASDVPVPADFNRTEGNLNAIETGSRTIDPTQSPASNDGTLRNLLDWFANRIKAITGTTNWWDAPAATISSLFAKYHATTGHKHSGAAGDAPHIPGAGATGRVYDDYTSVPAAGEATLTIPIGPDKTQARLHIYNDSNGSRSAIITCDATNTNSMGLTFSSTSTNQNHRAVDTLLTALFLGPGGDKFIRIKDCYISGANLVIVYDNYGGSAYVPNAYIFWQAV